MAAILTLAQRKGGAGKTTLAIHLAVGWRRAGRRVAMIDVDPQGSLAQWAELRRAALESPRRDSPSPRFPAGGLCVNWIARSGRPIS